MHDKSREIFTGLTDYRPHIGFQICIPRPLIKSPNPQALRQLRILFDGRRGTVVCGGSLLVPPSDWPGVDPARYMKRASAGENHPFQQRGSLQPFAPSTTALPSALRFHRKGRIGGVSQLVSLHQSAAGRRGVLRVAHPPLTEMFRSWAPLNRCRSYQN